MTNARYSHLALPWVALQACRALAYGWPLQVFRAPSLDMFLIGAHVKIYRDRFAVPILRREWGNMFSLVLILKGLKSRKETFPQFVSN